ncbi:hypothetical protein KZZ52_34635 [Dactylosporangium sp. AC04546]|uniref:hypothetical protein n=1 Tax=Dactylosporangium sp. AC04546 TaxID=2862460 RepID=UPI001EDE82BC|nr:hypothetical protein [Dactylosporangium sp. AC04546]WVK79108.1 hypothetical protein KZZ52_34635 [Dactylosporangium sp. AC04546]
MGVDWVPARPRAGADLGEVAGLVDVQVRFVRRLMFGAGDPGPGPGDGLLERLDIPVVNRQWPSFRVGAVVRNPVFPPEWRSAACSTMLPADARRVVGRWRWWHGEVGEFNRAVPAGFKTHAPRPAAASDAWVEDFFAWVTPWLDEEYGLYVWC